MHHWVGRLTVLLAVVNIKLGLDAYDAPVAWRVGIFTTIGLVWGVYAIAQLRQWVTTSRARGYIAIGESRQ